MTLTKAQLIEKLSFSTDLANSSKAEAGRIVDMIIDIVKTELQAGNSVDISGLCKFTIRKQAERSGTVNGIDYVSKAKNVVRIKPSKPLSDSVL